jgi:hypothetical protein
MGSFFYSLLHTVIQKRKYQIALGARQYSLNPEEQFAIYDYPELGTTVVGFSSCHENDHCNITGSVHLESISTVERRMRKAPYLDRLKIAVWHHHTSGNPDKYDYMDNRTLQHLIRANFHLGMHGHAHQTGIAYEPYRLQKDRQMVIISAGSLCAGEEELPSGELRTFNLIHVDRQNNEAKVDIFRDSKAGFSGSPIWTRYMEETIKLDVTSEVAPLPFTTANEQREELISPEIFIAVERLITDKSYELALNSLASLNKSTVAVRRLQLECYQGLRDHQAILQMFIPPHDLVEIRAIMIAAEQFGDRSTINAILQMQQVRASNDSFIKTMISRLEKWVHI